jgi:TonB family protein
MNRLQKKCFVVSTGVHLLLPVILVLGSALTPRSKTIEMPVLDFLAVDTNDKGVSGGGDPKAHTAPAEVNKPLVPDPKPPEPPTRKVEKPVEPDPPKDPVPPKVDAESVDARKDSNKKKLPEVPTTLTTRKNTTPKVSAKKAANEDTSDREAEKTRKDLAKAIGSAANDLRENRSSTTDVKLYGPGGGGVPYADFLQAVRAKYTQAWVVPEGVDDDEATTEVSVTIARNGTVVKKSIVKRSGNAAVDHSVQMTLDRVQFVAPLPTGAKEDERTVTIGFNIKAKRGVG